MNIGFASFQKNLAKSYERDLIDKKWKFHKLSPFVFTKTICNSHQFTTYLNDEVLHKIVSPRPQILIYTTIISYAFIDIL